MRRLLLAALAALPLAGCMTYTPAELSTMSAYDLCDLQHYQRVNLSAASKSALDNEFRRRNENCSGVMAQIERDHADDLYDRMYNRQSP